MAVDLVTTALSNLRSLYENERDLMLFVDQETKKLESYLSAIQCVLEDAEEKQLKNTSHALDNWLQKLEDVVYLLDDILDECATEAIREKYEGDKSCAFLSFLEPHKIIFRHDISRRMKGIRKLLDDIAEQKNQLNLVPSDADAVRERQAYASRHFNIPNERLTLSATTEDYVYGRDQDKENLVDHLLEDGSHAENLLVYPIVAMGGLGKTTLAKLVYNDKRVQDHFHPTIWICVSENFELVTLIKAIIESPQSEHYPQTLQKKLQDTLGGKRYLLVMDDVWNADLNIWNQLRHLLSCGSKGSSILVTTRQENIAKIMHTPPIEPYLLSALSDDDCWQVFRERAFGLSVVQETGNLVTIGKEIVRKCKGVPLAATVLGASLRFKTDEKSWLHVRDSELWNLTNEAGSILGALKLSYLNLPPRLRRCFSYCAVFPKDHRIEIQHIIHLWAANGLITPEGMTKEVEDAGHGIVRELSWRSLMEDIEIDKFGGIRSFKLHDLVHDVAQYVMRDEIHVVDGTSSMDLRERTRHLWINCEMEPSIASELVEKVTSLRTLTIQRSDKLITWFKSNLSKLTRLRALDLSWNKGLQELPSSICVLKHLRYINLTCSTIQGLPESICSLWNLQVLNLQWCSHLKTLPRGMGHLKSLQHLYMRGCWQLSTMPASMAGLTLLRTLDILIVGEGGNEKLGFQISALGRFKYVKGRMEIRHLERVKEVRHAQEAKLMEKRDLHSLILEWRHSDDGDDGDDADLQQQIHEALRPSPALKYMQVTGYRGASLPVWMMNDIASFRCIQDLRLRYCRNCSRLPPLWRLPSLKSLHLKFVDSLRFLIEIEGDSDGQVSFPSLEELDISCLARLEGLLETKNNNILLFPRLSSLKINRCPSFSSSGLIPLAPLRHLEIDDTGVLSTTSMSNHNVKILHSLETLSISQCQSQSHELFPDQMFQELTSLRSLSISCDNLKCFPDGVKYLSSLEELWICGCNRLLDISNAVRRLPWLRRLTIVLSPIASLDSPATALSGLQQGTPGLQSFELHACENLEHLPNWLGEAMNVRNISIMCCPKLKSIPNYFQRLTKLQRLEIIDCPELQRRCGSGTGEDWNNIAHVPYFSIR